MADTPLAPIRWIIRTEPTMRPFRREYLECGHWLVKQVPLNTSPTQRRCKECLKDLEGEAR